MGKSFRYKFCERWFNLRDGYSWGWSIKLMAAVAQLVEHLRYSEVVSSNPTLAIFIHTNYHEGFSKCTSSRKIIYL